LGMENSLPAPMCPFLDPNDTYLVSISPRRE
jgi:hypothetical protein